MISIHLSDEELTAAAAGERSPRTAGHLEMCPQCWEQMSLYRERLASLRQDVCYSAGRSALDWGRQSRSIQQRIADARIRKTQGWNAPFALAASALAIGLFIFVFLGFHNPPPQTEHAQTAISDAALLSDIQARLDQELPDALQPAGLLVSEMGGIDTGSTHSHTSRMRTTQQ